MQIEDARRHLAENSERIEALLRPVDEDTARRRPDEESWSAIEVINHLYDEEREDFRVRLDILLHRPDEPWPPINPPGWVTERRYIERSLAPSLQGFLSERAGSLAWLDGLANVDLKCSGPTPWGGTIRAGDMLAAWVAHDLLHMRQIVEVFWSLTEHAVQPYDNRYAGEW